MRSVVVLPQPLGPSSTTVSPAVEGQVHRIEGARAVGEGLAAAFESYRMPLIACLTGRRRTGGAAAHCMAISKGMMMTKKISV